MNTIEQHMQLSQQQRQAHIDEDSECYGYVITRGTRKGQLSDISDHAKHSLLDFHSIEEFKSRKIHTCHLCPNDTSKPNGFICVNPKHLYFGTASENMMDRPEDVRKKCGKHPSSDKHKKAVAKIGAKNAPESTRKAMKNGNHISQQIHTCPVCGFEGKGGATMKRWHFDNCKHKK